MILVLGNSVGLEETALTTRFSADVSTSATLNGIGPIGPESSFVVRFEIGEIVGRSLTGVTVKTNERRTAVMPSLTLRVIVVTPDWFVAGRIVMLRVTPLPPRTTLFEGTSEALDESTVKIRLSGELSGSLIVKPIEVAVSSGVTWSGMPPMVGGAAVVVTVRLQPEAITPWSPGPSSTRYKDHVPLADCPLKTERALGYGPTGAGAGMESPGSKSAGRY